MSNTYTTRFETVMAKILMMMMIFYCSYRNKILHAAIYLFGLGTRHYRQEFKHM
jgi:hypothetical protein